MTEKAMASHSSTLAWKISWMEEPGRLQSMRRVGNDWATSLSFFTFMHWRRKWQPPPVFLPGESQGRGSLVGCRLWGRTESDTTEATWQQQQQQGLTQHKGVGGNFSSECHLRSKGSLLRMTYGFALLSYYWQSTTCFSSSYSCNNRDEPWKHCAK